MGNDVEMPRKPTKRDDLEVCDNDLWEDVGGRKKSNVGEWWEASEYGETGYVRGNAHIRKLFLEGAFGIGA